MTELRILVADDSQSMRSAYERILDSRDNFDIVGMASDGQEALEMAIELVPDVVILDVRMPKLDGLAVANRLTEQVPQTAIILVSAYDDLAFIRAIMHNGASGRAYLLKSSLDDISEFIRVVEAVASGQAVLHRATAQDLLSMYQRQNMSPPQQLTDPEESILRLMFNGSHEDDISKRLGLPIEELDLLITSLCEKSGFAPQQGLSRSPQLVQAMVNACVP